MFLWARLVLDYLSTNIFYSLEEVRQAVDVLPNKLSELHVHNRLVYTLYRMLTFVSMQLRSYSF